MHKPVLTNETIKALNPKSEKKYLDCTFGFGGHSLEILNICPTASVLGIEWDTQSLDLFKKEHDLKKWEGRLQLENANYADLSEILDRYNFRPLDGAIIDLGLSSWHLDRSGKGFSYLKDEKLDMRYSQESSLSAYEIINHWPEMKIGHLIRDFGEEKFWRKIASKIIFCRQKKPISTTKELKAVIESVLPGRPLHFRERSVARTFQALRIAVNSELDNLIRVLPQVFGSLDSGGRLIIISFHSLEDRLVKNFFRNLEKEEKAKIIFKKPITANKEEIKINPRSRSAKLRAIIKK